MKTLVIHQGGLGDVLLALPAVRSLKDALGGEIELWCQGQIGRLAHELGYVDHWRAIEGRIMVSLYAPDPDPAAVALFSAYSHVILFSFSTELEENVRAMCLAEVVRVTPRPEPGVRIQVAEHLVRELVAAQLLDASAAERAVRLMESRRASTEARCPVLIHPGSGSPRKCWPVSRFVELRDALLEQGIEACFVIGPAETHLTGELVAAGVDAERIHELGSLSQLTELLQTARGFVGNDSGVTHLAAQLGVPTTAVFGPSDPERWRPLGPAVRVVRPDTECLPCFEKERNNCGNPLCLARTSVGDVLGEYLRLESSQADVG